MLFPSPGDLPDPGIEPESPVNPVWSGRFFTAESLGSPNCLYPNSKLKVFCFSKKKKSGLWSGLTRALAVVKLVYPCKPYDSGDLLSGNPYPIESLTRVAVPLALNSDGGEDDNAEGTMWVGHSLCSCPGRGRGEFVSSLHPHNNLLRWGSGIPIVQARRPAGRGFYAWDQILCSDHHPGKWEERW